LGRPNDVYQHKLSRLDRAAASQTQTGRGGGALTRVGAPEAMGGGGPSPSGGPSNAMMNQDMRSSMHQRTMGGGGGALGRVEEDSSKKIVPQNMASSKREDIYIYILIFDF
jgi:hypothetical protein